MSQMNLPSHLTASWFMTFEIISMSIHYREGSYNVDAHSKAWSHILGYVQVSSKHVLYLST
jgi:hypothetical protein